MSYYTKYELVINSDINFVYLENLIKKLGFNPFSSNCQWYEHEEDLTQYSMQNPNILFILKGQGEEAEDAWVKYFKNGKKQVCHAKIIYDPFDESKME